MNKFKIGDRVCYAGSRRIEETITVKAVVGDYCCVEWSDSLWRETCHSIYLVPKEEKKTSSSPPFDPVFYLNSIKISEEIDLWYQDFMEKIRDRMFNFSAKE